MQTDTQFCLQGKETAVIMLKLLGTTAQSLVTHYLCTTIMSVESVQLSHTNLLDQVPMYLQKLSVVPLTQGHILDIT
jgi:hypothetical protein